MTYTGLKEMFTSGVVSSKGRIIILGQQPYSNKITMYGHKRKSFRVIVPEQTRSYEYTEQLSRVLKGFRYSETHRYMTTTHSLTFLKDELIAILKENGYTEEPVFDVIDYTWHS